MLIFLGIFLDFIVYVKVRHTTFLSQLTKTIMREKHLVFYIYSVLRVYTYRHLHNLFVMSLFFYIFFL
jgi:hypothetical protein